MNPPSITIQRFLTFPFERDEGFLKGLELLKISSTSNSEAFWKAKCFYYSKTVEPISFSQVLPFLPAGIVRSPPKETPPACPFAKKSHKNIGGCPYLLRKSGTSADMQDKLSKLKGNKGILQWSFSNDRNGRYLLFINVPALVQAVEVEEHNIKDELSTFKKDFQLTTNADLVIFILLSGPSHLAPKDLFSIFKEKHCEIVVAINGLIDGDWLGTSQARYLCTENGRVSLKGDRHSQVIVDKVKTPSLQRLLSRFADGTSSIFKLYAADLLQAGLVDYFVPFEELPDFIDQGQDVKQEKRRWCGVSNFQVFAKEIDEWFSPKVMQDMQEEEVRRIVQELRQVKGEWTNELAQVLLYSQ